MMRMRHVLLLAVVCSFLFSLIGLAQSQDSGEVARKLVRKVEPLYPEMARKMHLGGTVRVVAVVAADGNVKKVEPVGGSPLLVQAAQDAVTHWKYAPGAESRQTIELHFTP